MKKFKIFYLFIIVFVSIISITACTELKDEPFTSIISTTFNPAKEDVAALVGAGYSQWRIILLDWNGLWRAQELTGDQLVIPKRPWGWFDDGVYQRLHKHTWTSDDEVIRNTWSRTYAGITNCNRIIYQIESELIPITDGKEATLAELKVLRASYYAILCDFYGNVPIVTQFDLPQGFLPEQNTDDNYATVHIYESPNDPDRYLTVTNISHSINKKGESKKTRQTVLEYFRITDPHF